MIDALSKLEPGLSNSVSNVRFEKSAVKIAEIKKASNLLQADREKLIAEELKIVREQFEILSSGSEGKALLESRLQRVISQCTL